MSEDRAIAVPECSLSLKININKILLHSGHVRRQLLYEVPNRKKINVEFNLETWAKIIKYTVYTFRILIFENYSYML